MAIIRITLPPSYATTYAHKKASFRHGWVAKLQQHQKNGLRRKREQTLEAESDVARKNPGVSTGALSCDDGRSARTPVPIISDDASAAYRARPRGTAWELTPKIRCEKRSNVGWKRSAACKPNSQCKCEDERDKDHNLSNLERGSGPSFFVWPVQHASKHIRKAPTEAAGAKGSIVSAWIRGAPRRLYRSPRGSKMALSSHLLRRSDLGSRSQEMAVSGS